MDGASSGGETGLPLRALAAQITELAGHLNAANYRWLTLVADFDRRKGWSDSVTQSCAQGLNWKCGLDIGAACEKVRVAHALARLPRVSAAMANGTLSYAKVRAVHEGGINIDANTAATGWRGVRMDYGIAIDALLHRTQANRASTISEERTD